MLEKKSVSLLLAILLVLTSGTVIQAHGNDSVNDLSYVVTPFYKYISVVGASISVSNTARQLPAAQQRSNPAQDLKMFAYALRRLLLPYWSASRLYIS